jgi:hypothetical protein
VPASDLLQTVANHLSGRKVDVYMDDRSLDGYGVLGQSRVIGDERGAIQIVENMGSGGKLHTFLHEVAHLKFGHKDQDPNNESQAVLLSRQWEKFASANSNLVGNPRQPEHERQLRALLLIPV